MKQSRNKPARPPLDREGLERLALSYAGRYATTRAKLRGYLERKLWERGWAGAGDPPTNELVERFSELGYVDDAAFATARAASLGRRGYGARRVEAALRASGIESAEMEMARDAARRNAWDSALRFSERRGIGPFATTEPDRVAREKAFAAMMRAGHPIEIIRRILSARPGEIPDGDSA